MGLVCDTFIVLTYLSLTVKMARSDLLVVSPVISQLQGQLDKGIRTYLLRFGVVFPKLMKDQDDDIQVFDHSARKERGCVPSPVAACCNIKLWTFMKHRENRLFGSDLCRDREIPPAELSGQLLLLPQSLSSSLHRFILTC